MVYLPPPQLAGGQPSYADAYNKILTAHRRAHLNSASSATMLVAPDVDALCAARMLANLFKQDDVNYRIIPVSGIVDLLRHKDELKQQPNLLTLILINMGIRYDLPTPDWFGDINPQVTVHVIDSSRPQSLANLFTGGENGERVVIWDDGGAEKLTEEKKSWEFIQYEPAPASEDEWDDDSSLTEEDDEEEEGNIPPGHAQDDVPSDSPSTKRKRTYNNSAKKRRRLELRGSRISREEYQRHIDLVGKHYTAGTWHVPGAAYTVYLLATLLERVDNDSLWFAIVGLTFQYTSSRISRADYDKLQSLYCDEVSRLNPLPANVDTNYSTNPDDVSVRTSEELRFTLFRHWTLYDAMFHSSYVASKLGIWKEKGRQRLTGLLAKMGFSIPQTQQPYSHMDRDLKQVLIQKLDEIAPEYGLVELQYPSFLRFYGYQSQPLSAADAVEGIHALLDVAKGVRLEVEVEGTRNGGEWFGGGRIWEVNDIYKGKSNSNVETPSFKTATEPDRTVINGARNVSDNEQREEETPLWWRKNFWVAYDALLDIKSLKQSLNLAMSLHRSIIRQGTSIIDKQDIKTMRNHRVVVLSQGPDLPLFSHPGVLTRLALWLVDALRDRLPATSVGTRSKKKGLPFVVACLNENTDQYLIVGVMAAADYGQVIRNDFSTTFLKAAEHIAIPSSQADSFETTVLEVKKHELKTFLSALCV